MGEWVSGRVGECGEVGASVVSGCGWWWASGACDEWVWWASGCGGRGGVVGEWGSGGERARGRKGEGAKGREGRVPPTVAQWKRGPWTLDLGPWTAGIIEFSGLTIQNSEF